MEKMQQFSHLSPAEQQQLLNAPALVALLVGAADGNFDREEKKWATKLVTAKTFSKTASLRFFWEQVQKDFLEKIALFSSKFPTNADERNRLISKELEDINPILLKLDAHLAWYFYRGMLDLAEETAKASGGFLRIGAVSSSEYRWVKLPMLTEIKKPADLKNEADEDEEQKD